jgi:hypothetical protein
VERRLEIDRKLGHDRVELVGFKEALP